MCFNLLIGEEQSLLTICYSVRKNEVVVMVLRVRPSEQGRLVVISGPVGSAKTEPIQAFLDAASDSGFKRDSNLMVFRHPSDDSDPNHIGRHEARVSGSVDEIYESIGSHTGTVVIAGASHYQDSRLVPLLDAIVRSNRQLVVSCLNLDVDGKPHGLIPEIMALADEVVLAKGICGIPDCIDVEASRSGLWDTRYVARCSPHYYYYPNSPDSEAGKLHVYVGSMFSGKTTLFLGALQKMHRAGRSCALLNYARDNRYDGRIVEPFEEGSVTLNDGRSTPATAVLTGEHVDEYIQRNPSVKNVFINEPHFMPGLYDVVLRRMGEGYNFVLDGLLRGFNRKGFNEMPAFLALADDVTMPEAICVTEGCGRPARENQRMKRLSEGAIPLAAHYDDPFELIGGKDRKGASYFYQARCLDHWELKGEPILEFRLNSFRW